MLVNHLNGPAALYRNDRPPGPHWLGLELKDQAIGAQVHLTCDGRIQFRVVATSGTYLSAHDPRLHFGLGDCTRVEHIDILWPSGQTSELSNVAIDRYLTVEAP